MSPFFPFLRSQSLFLAFLCLTPLSVHAQPPLIPDGSAMAGCSPDMPRLLLNPMEDGTVITPTGNATRHPAFEIYKDIDAKIGQVALKLEGVAEFGSAKPVFVLSKWAPGHIRYLGAWIYLTPDSNVDKIGFQGKDADGKPFTDLVPADWKGWKWLETDLQKAFGGSGTTGYVMQEVDIAWTAKAAGPTFVGADGLAAVAQPDPNGKAYAIQTTGSNHGEANAPFTGQVIVDNFSNKPVDLDISYSIQTNPLLYDKPLPDPVLGSNRAVGCKSWVELEGKRIENNALTDGDTQTSYGSDWINEHFTEGDQFVDLGQERKIIHLDYHAGNAGKTHKVDISSSTDGATYTPIEGLQGFVLAQKWGLQTFPLTTPLTARYLKFHYHDDGKKLNFINGFAELYVYDGVEHEKIELPKVGDLVDSKTIHVTVPPGNFSLVPIVSSMPLQTGSYYYGLSTKGPDGLNLSTMDYFVRSAEEVKIRPEGRFGMNVAVPDYIPELKRMGVSWVRFENMKWCFYNSAPGNYSFDGSVPPNVPLDYCMKEYYDAGISILPYTFLVPDWATSAGPEVPKGRWSSYPPKDYNDYENAMYELAARYGTNKNPPDGVHTTDKKAGLGWITTYEIWNEPNNDPSWGAWAAPFSKFLDIFRYGAEGVKKADPNSKVTSAGFSGLSMDTVDQLRTHKYADGKTPLDFTDILNVHFYSGKQEPEYAVDDPNANRDGRTPGTKTYEQYVLDLSDWRDAVKPGMPIWLTETGNDVGGPIGRTERYQAAKLPRDLMISLANGVEKVMIYREAGSDEDMHAGSGMFRNDKSIRPSYFTLATLFRQLDGVTDLHTLRLKTADPKVWLYNWKRPTDYVLTAWTPEDTVPLGLDLGKCRVTDSFGTVKDMDVTRDFPLSIFPVYITQITNHAAIDTLQKEAADREEQRKKVVAFYMNKAHFYLYDFGSHQNAVNLSYGVSRPVIPVVSTDPYDAKNGYGFLSKNGKDEWVPWEHIPLEKGSVAFSDPQGFQFQVDAAPGTYNVELRAKDSGPDAKLTITGADGGDVTVPLANPITKTQVTAVAGHPLQFQVPSNIKVHWLTLIEAVPKGP